MIPYKGRVWRAEAEQNSVATAGNGPAVMESQTSFHQRIAPPLAITVREGRDFSFVLDQFLSQPLLEACTQAMLVPQGPAFSILLIKR